MRIELEHDGSRVVVENLENDSSYSYAPHEQKQLLMTMAFEALYKIRPELNRVKG